MDKQRSPSKIKQQEENLIQVNLHGRSPIPDSREETGKSGVIAAKMKANVYI